MLLVDRKPTFSCLLFLIIAVSTIVSASDTSTSQPGAAQLSAVPPGAADPAGSGDIPDMGGSISSPAGGSDAKTILAGSSHMMGSTDDSTDDDGAGSSDGQKQVGGGQGGHSGGHNGHCVTACATKSTQGAGCGSDLSQPECFCKSQNFIQQTFSCINATCPQQYHGAAGVVTSLCGVSGASDLQIPGYQGSSNLENMPTINDDGNKNATNSTGDGTPLKPNSTTGTSGATSTLSVPVSAQTPISGVLPPGTGTSSSSTGSNGNTGTNKSSSGVSSREKAGVVAVFTVAAMVASAGMWTLF
ncbi:uncharacterized protein MEPE_04985 [Melanopsichium pennsylvanicum]|uniref:CFEM domain-containing protein n=2 Tax=Melanopsichium pennsylvanicum TaxID=63383 RepID=A0AAJ4XQW8_9BASI|nr:conserved hypothetical protein [Melanopsichium pennsylvanicum 4]SNX86276.1 uncharacterized protein MEPE_04985 [Melanopsichium pennsylvanicum]